MSASSYLIVLNDAPYGSEQIYNGLRLAASLARREGLTVRVFLMGDAASAAKRNQKVPAGYYNMLNMLSAVTSRGGTVGVCGTCMEARGIAADELAEGTHRSSLDELTDWVTTSGRVLVFRQRGSHDERTAHSGPGWRRWGNRDRQWPEQATSCQARSRAREP
jgi:uncharacterized protein involved in oxidation of intracellular sulfur